MAARRRWALHLVSGTLLAILLGFVGNGILVLGYGSVAPSVPAQVTEAGYSDEYHARFTTADGTTCDVYLNDRPGKVVVGQRVTVRTAGWPGACDHAWDTADRWWWVNYLLGTVVILGVAALVFMAWRRPDTLGRWALRYDRRSGPSR